ncbi:MAG: hydroxymethylbilane synthase [Thermoleophilaceae bacterium]
MTLRLGTRGSALALAQARLVADRLGSDVEIVTVRTSGDRDPAAPRGDKARFVKELEDALLHERVDIAVHSAKDVPAELPDGLAIAGVPERADARDAVCGAGSLEALGEGAAIGTSSLRRRAQLLALRPDLEVLELRGNVDTRLGRLAEGAYDALVLAAAGLARLERSAEGTPIDASELTPAPGQGALALEARAEDDRAREAAESLTDRDSLVRLTAERALVAELEASCRTPVAAYAELADGRLRLSAFAGLPDGSHWIRDGLESDAAQPGELGREVAARMLAAGARELLAAAERADA